LEDEFKDCNVNQDVLMLAQEVELSEEACKEQISTYIENLKEPANTCILK
jgi:hypothetical protein